MVEAVRAESVSPEVAALLVARDAHPVDIEAQLALWKSGALSSTQAALQAAATEYAEEAAHYLGLVIRGAVGGLL